MGLRLRQRIKFYEAWATRPVTCGLPTIHELARLADAV